MTTKYAAGVRPKSGGRITPFGQKLRDIRIAKGLLLIDLAEIAEVSPGFLSLVESGQKPIPDRLLSSLVRGLKLTAREAKELSNAAALSAREFRIEMQTDADPLDRRLAHALQTGFAKMTPRKKQQMLELMEGE